MVVLVVVVVVNTATLLLKESRTKNHSVHFLWTKELSTNAFESEVHPSVW